ncbi:YjhX family toxin [Nitratireductor soli]|uniref:YjhX family toxin n=1 Tax=Nitratireductor soli TaxID=1670619 RepID=UPI00065DD24E|nr:YjhX family toxin [Nitratireductor soli]
MDISRAEQRILHILAQGGRIDVEKDENGRIHELSCVTRDGWYYPGLEIGLFRKMKRKRAIQSRNGGPYRITRRGLALVRSQPDNR